MTCTTCEHSEEEANIVKCSVEVNIDESDMDTSNNTKEDKATTMITFLRTVGTDYPHKLMYNCSKQSVCSQSLNENTLAFSILLGQYC